MIPASAHDFVAVPLNEVDPDTGNYHTVVRYDNFVRNLLKADTDPMMKIHAAMGISGEAGELLSSRLRRPGELWLWSFAGGIPSSYFRWQ